MTYFNKRTQTNWQGGSNFLSKWFTLIFWIVFLISIIVVWSKIKNDIKNVDVVNEYKVYAEVETVKQTIPDVVLIRYKNNKKQRHNAEDNEKKYIERENKLIRNTYPNINDYYDWKY